MATERQPNIKHLVVDTSPLLTSPLSSLRGMAQRFLVTREVVSEMKDKRARDIMAEAELQLPAHEQGSKSGFIVRDPSAEAVAKVTAFARKTGDIAVLSTADIRVLALCLTMELEENGGWRIRESPGQKIVHAPPKPAEPENLQDAVRKLDIASAEDDDESPVPSTSAAAPADAPATTPVPAVVEADAPENSQEETQQADEIENEDDEDDGNDSDSSGGSWITPNNLQKHQTADLGLFAPVEDESKLKTFIKAAVLTGDFAMQNVGIQMGLNVLGNGGKRVKEVKTWVLRCHACFKICKNPEKRFCPACGNPTLLRTSITYVPATPENPQGYILHLKKNFQYKNRGTRYSLPTPKMGKAGGVNANIVLREDQKEWVKGVRGKEVRQAKEERAMVRALMDEQEKGGVSSVMFGRREADWLPAMALGEKGRKRGGKNGAGGELRTDSSGLPVIGHGRKNPNQARRKV